MGGKKGEEFKSETSGDKFVEKRFYVQRTRMTENRPVNTFADWKRTIVLYRAI